MTRYTIVSKSYERTKRGAITVADRLEAKFPGRVRSVSVDEICSVGELRAEGDTIVLFTQAPHKYGSKHSMITQHETDVTFIRDDYSPLCWNNSASNGFSYWKEHPRIKMFVPTITESGFRTREFDGVPTIGGYVRPNVARDSYVAFMRFVRSLKFDVRVMTMGANVFKDYFRPGDNVLSVDHTYSNEEFFSNVTHYFYYKSETFVDPFPNSMVEAIDAGCHVVVPSSTRKFKDGIDDILECCYWTESIETPTHYVPANSETCFQPGAFDSYYKRLFDNGFRTDYQRDDYESFREWCEAEL